MERGFGFEIAEGLRSRAVADETKACRSGRPLTFIGTPISTCQRSNQLADASFYSFLQTKFAASYFEACATLGHGDVRSALTGTVSRALHRRDRQPRGSGWDHDEMRCHIFDHLERFVPRASVAATLWAGHRQTATETGGKKHMVFISDFHAFGDAPSRAVTNSAMKCPWRQRTSSEVSAPRTQSGRASMRSVHAQFRNPNWGELSAWFSAAVVCDCCCRFSVRPPISWIRCAAANTTYPAAHGRSGRRCLPRRVYCPAGNVMPSGYSELAFPGLSKLPCYSASLCVNVSQHQT